MVHHQASYISFVKVRLMNLEFTHNASHQYSSSKLDLPQSWFLLRTMHANFIVQHPGERIDGILSFLFLIPSPYRGRCCVPAAICSAVEPDITAHAALTLGEGKNGYEKCGLRICVRTRVCIYYLQQYRAIL